MVKPCQQDGRQIQKTSSLSAYRKTKTHTTVKKRLLDGYICGTETGHSVLRLVFWSLSTV